ncbi:MAG: hypothetical protein AAB531_03645 [Patescibacteria group bacterium]
MSKTEVPSLNLPIGLGNLLEERAVADRELNAAIFSPVKNRVMLVNPQIYSPLNLIEGESSPVGVFLSDTYSNAPYRAEMDGEMSLEILPFHRRSALLGRVLFSDTEGRIYRDIDIKGSGNLRFGFSGGPARMELGRIYHGDKNNLGGLMEKDYALHDYELSEEFLKAGIRTHRTIGIIRLWEVVNGNTKISLRGVSKYSINQMHDNFRSVIQIRAFGTRARVTNKDDTLLFEDARKMVSQELGMKRPMSNKEYIRWFAKTLGRNVGLMHENGWTHRYLSDHNVTLDCRIVDLDSVGSDEYKRFQDYVDARGLVYQLSEFKISEEEREKCKEIYADTYLEAFSGGIALLSERGILPVKHNSPS